MELGRPIPGEETALAAIVLHCNAGYQQWAPAGWQLPDETSAERRRIEDEATRTLVARAEGAPVGFAGWRPSRRRRGVGDLHSLFVDPDAWGYGFGRALLRAALAEIAASGAAGAELWVSDGNTRATALYESEGWEPTGELRRHLRLGLELRRYEKLLGGADAAWLDRS